MRISKNQPIKEFRKESHYYAEDIISQEGIFQIAIKRDKDEKCLIKTKRNNNLQFA